MRYVVLRESSVDGAELAILMPEENGLEDAIYERPITAGRRPRDDQRPIRRGSR